MAYFLTYDGTNDRSLQLNVLTVYFYWQERKFGQRLNIIVVAEGAVDLDGNLINAESLKEVMLISMYIWVFDVMFYILQISYTCFCVALMCSLNQ